MKRHIPNSITLLNLFFGCCAIIFLFKQDFIAAVVCVGISAVLDYFDGFAARVLKVQSPLGKELDSMADMVSFGVVPACALYQLLLLSSIPEFYIRGLNVWALPAFLVAVSSGLRLAKFNLDTRQTHDFIGLATPASTALVLGLLLIYHYDSFGYKTLMTTPTLLYVVIFGLSFLLNAEIPMFSLKIKGLRWEGNEIKIIFAAIAIIALVTLQSAALAVVMILYIAFGILNKFINNS